MMKKIIETANEIKDKVDTIDIEYVLKNERFFAKFFEYSGYCEDMKSFITSQTNFKYEPFQNISIGKTLNAPEKLVYIYKLSQIFEEDFIKSIDVNWKFDKLEDFLLEFISKNPESTIIEYKLLKSLLGKFLILLGSNIEQGFCLEKININEDTETYLKTFTSKIQSTKNNMSKSWDTFINSLFNKTEIFILRDKEKFEKLIEEGYKNHFLLETLVGNFLKSFQTNVLVDYFHAIRLSYIWCRLVSIYIQKTLKKGFDKNKLMEDIFIISSIIASMYEDFYFISSILPKSLPTNDNLTEETILYFLNHTIKGPQYIILKQLEYSGPCVMNIK